jgi:hypothetical protein
MSTLPIGNIYAPPWMCVSPSIAGYQDLEFDISLPAATSQNAPTGIAVAAASFSVGNTLQLDNDYDYLIREMWFVVLPSTGLTYQPSDLRVRIRDTEARLVTSDYVQAQNLCGPLPIIWGLKRGGVVTFDFYNTNSANAMNVVVILKGWKRQACPGVPAFKSNYAPMFSRYADPIDKTVRLEDYEYYFTFTATGASDLLRLPLQTDNDADFLWRGVQGDWSTANNDVSVLSNAALTFYIGNNYLNQAPNTVPWGSANAGEMREVLLSNGGGAPMPIYPEIRIPRGGIAQLDVSFAGAATVRLSLRGLKVYTGRNC